MRSSKTVRAEKLRARASGVLMRHVWSAAGELNAADELYHSALRKLDFVAIWPADAEQRTARIKCWLNLAAVGIKSEQWRDAADMCDHVLECDPRHVKALYRRADVRDAPCAHIAICRVRVARAALTRRCRRAGASRA